MSSKHTGNKRKRGLSSDTPIHASKSTVSTFLDEDNGQLPIAQYREKLVNHILARPVTVVVGETGSGKSTQLPQYLCDAIMKKKDGAATGSRRSDCIVCTQPRRVAAVTIAKRVASERGCKIGQEVGYSIRFDDCSSAATRIKFVTDGVLLREALTDSNLSRYSIVILDEAHERSLQTDILMGILKMLLSKRSDLRVVIMSATLESDLFISYFNQAALVSIHGRQFPVDVYYTKEAEADFLDAAFLTCLQIHEEEEEGGVLVFLPGQEDIDGLRILLMDNLSLILPRYLEKSALTDNGIEEKYRRESAYVIHTLYAAMSPEQQLRAFERPPAGVRKFVLSTNIAETSVTIPGIKYVVDPGLVKVRSLQANTGIDMLRVDPVSQSQANQRAGRAGRESAGKCFRLYRDVEFEKLDLCATPEIQRISVAQAMLQLISMGISNVVDFPYPSPPSQNTLRKALEQLLCLGALQKDMKISAHGRNLAALPLEPIYANLLLASKNFGCTYEILTVVSMLSSDNLFIQPHGEAERKAAGKAHMSFASIDGDFISLINIYEAWKHANKDRVWTRRHYLNERALLHAEQVRNQLTQTLVQLGPSVGIDVSSSCLPEREPILKCFTFGLFLQSAMRKTPGQADSSAWISGKRASFDGMNSSGKSSISTSGRMVIATQHSDASAAYVTVRGGQVVHIHPSSVLFGASGGGSKRDRLPKHVVYAEQVITSKSYIRYVSRIEGEWLVELRPDFFHGAVVESAQKPSSSISR